ncbi:MAG TPA: methanogenesis marker 8 protein [Methanotrichaceae archaeon]|nr:methanogenesis marker 8 protein [Methanotrichaceae archaeon]
MSEHLLEMAGAKARIRDGRIEVLSDPQIRCCPLRRELYGFQEESRETVKLALEKHMAELGMYGPGRTLVLDQKPVSFGASEIITDAMAEGLVDAAVVVCEGAGTVVVASPKVLQAVGAHMTGLISTEPIVEVQDGLAARGCLLLDRNCTIDQVQGYVLATCSGFKKIAVTITGHRAFEARKIREMEACSQARPIILAVHNTGISSEEAELLAEDCDLVWSCASRSVREVTGRRARMQMGLSIPVFAMTTEGKRLMLNRALHFDDGLIIHRAGLPYGRGGGKDPEPLL